MEWLELLQYSVIAIVLIYFGYLVLLYTNQEKMLFNSQSAAINYIDLKAAKLFAEKDFKMSLKELNAKTKEGNIITGFLLTKYEKQDSIGSSNNMNSSKSRITIIYFHPNSYNLPEIFRYCATTISKLNCNIVSFALRGYGNSVGTPTAAGLVVDGEAVIDFVLNDSNLEIDQNNIYVLGRSLGGSIAIQSVPKFNNLIRGVILENTFSSMDDLVKDKYPEILCFRKCILKIKIDNLRVVSSLTCPILYLVSKEDEVVPYKNSLRLIESSQKSKFLDFQIFNLAGHSELYEYAYKSYYAKLTSFIQRCSTEKFREDHVLDLEDNILLTN